METNVELIRASEPLNVLLIGNNPIDMGKTLEKLNQIRGRKIITEIAFDLKSIVERLIRFNPNFILIDDNIGKTELGLTIDTLSRTRKTKNIPITVLKNSNYQESSSSSTSWALDYLLKQNFSSESLYMTIRNSLKFKRTQLYLYQAYRKRKGQLLRAGF
jgi:DNA-binding response OmpR family regulator